MSENSNPHALEDWDACEAGELRQVVWRLKSRRRNDMITRIGGVAVVLLLVAFAGTLVIQSMQAKDAFNFGGITCEEVQDNFSAYVDGEVTPKLANRIRTHLSKCPHCKKPQEARVTTVAAASRESRRRIRSGGGDR